MGGDGRPLDRLPVLPGDVFATLTGRATTAYPSARSVRKASGWLVDNAVAEARARGDAFNARIFSNTQLLPKGELTMADRDSLLMYLFEWQPRVVRSIFGN